MSEKSFFRDIVKISGTNTVETVVMLLVGIIIARILGPDGRGLFELILVVPTMVINFAEMGVRRSTIYHIGRKDFPEEKLIAGLLHIFILSNIIGIAATSVTYYYYDDSRITLLLAVLGILVIPARLIRKYIGGIYNGTEEFNKVIFLRFSFFFLQLLFTIIFVWVVRLGVFGALFALVASNLIVTVVSLVMVSRDFRVGFSWQPEIIKSIIKMGFLFTLSMFLIQLHTRIDVLLLGKLAGVREIGYYTLAVSVAEKWLIPFAVGTVVISRSANMTDINRFNKDMNRLIRVSFLLGIVAFAFLYFLAPYVITGIYSRKFLATIPMLRMILPGILMLVITKLIGSRIAGDGRPEIMIYITIPSLLLNVLLNFLWIPEHGGVGAAMATNVSYIFATILMVIVYCRMYHVRFFDMLVFTRSDIRFATSFFLKKFRIKK